MNDPRKHEYEFNKLAKRIRRQVGEAIADFGMIEDGDRVMVCLSGGKDSYGLLDVLLKLKEKAPISFELIGCDPRRVLGPPHSQIRRCVWAVECNRGRERRVSGYIAQGCGEGFAP